jgi:type IV pilus assembly protein PilW
MNRYQRGQSLVELLISLVLGLTVSAGISELFIQIQETYRTQHALSYMMEDGRYVLEIMSKELRQTGFLRNKLAIDGKADQLFRAEPAVLESETISPQIDLAQKEFIHGAIKDAFVLKYQLNNKYDLSATDPNNSLSPCVQNLTLDSGEDPETQAHVVTTYFYVKNDSDNIPTLYCSAKREIVTIDDVTCVKPANCSKTMPTGLPIVSNVEKLVVKYGIKTDPNGTPDNKLDDEYYYVSANEVIDWTQVIAAKLFVVMRSEYDGLTQKAATYRIEDSTYKATDHRFYRVFSTTIAFRNGI